MDLELRTGLWDAFYISIIKDWVGSQVHRTIIADLFQKYWHIYFKWPTDQIPPWVDDVRKIIREYLFKCAWFEVYDFIEFTAQESPSILQKKFIDFCNAVLEREMSACRLVGKEIVEITAEEEIASIEKALTNTDRLKGAHAHLESALAKMSDRKNPDYRNSIKESISSVESLAKVLTGQEKATLGEALNVLEKRGAIHPALKSGLSSLYGYASDEGGIRHAMLEEPNLTFNDAKFMLVACTAFINYLIGKAAEKGVKLS